MIPIDTSPKIEAILRERFAAMSGSERVFMASQMFDTARLIVLSSFPAEWDETTRQRELCRRLHGEALAERVFGHKP